MKKVVSEALLVALLLTGWAVFEVYFRDGADGRWYEALTVVLAVGIAVLLGGRWGKFLRVKRSANSPRKLATWQAYAIVASIGVPTAVFSMYVLTSLFGMPNFPAHVVCLFVFLVVMVGILAAHDYV